MAGTVVLEVGGVLVVVVLAVVVSIGVLVVVTLGAVVVGSDAAPAVVPVKVGVLVREPGEVEVVVTPAGAPPGPPGKAGPDELAEALLREWTGR